MNLQETKALFVAQYYGQDVLQFNKNNTDELSVGELDWCSFRDDFWPNQCLLLRSVEQLTDEEQTIIIEICKYYRFTTSGKDIAKSLFNGLDPQNQGDAIITYQYLLRIGILLPFTYLDENNKPVTLTPDQIVNLGWAKINK